MTVAGEWASERPVAVTGAARGIGLAYAQAFLKAGHPVAFLDLDREGAERAAVSNQSLGSAFGYHCDVADESSVEQAFAKIEGDLGAPYALVNNAALFVDLPEVNINDIDVAAWDRVMQVNLRGPFLCARRVLPAMVQRREGRIINISSTRALVGGTGRLHYAASKAGVLGLTRALAREVGQFDVTVNAVAPGGTESVGVIETYTQDARSRAIAGRSITRALLPEDLVGAVLFLASRGASMVTGQTLIVDGGSVFS